MLVVSACEVVDLVEGAEDRGVECDGGACLGGVVFCYGGDVGGGCWCGGEEGRGCDGGCEDEVLEPEAGGSRRSSFAGVAVAEVFGGEVGGGDGRCGGHVHLFRGVVRMDCWVAVLAWIGNWLVTGGNRRSTCGLGV